MHIYSKQIIRFITDVKQIIKYILSKEINLKIHGNRFYDRQQKTSYPIHVVIYNHRSALGYFDPYFYELGFHECLMHSSKEQLHNVIRHELAHYVTFINYGETKSPHSAEFRAFCQRMGWGEAVSAAATVPENRQAASDIKESAIFRKVQKLMALTTSCHKNEAEQAMIKSQQLLLKHNMESTYMSNEGDEKIILKRIMKQKKENAKMRAISRILATFFVSTVYSRAGEFTYLEILGNELNIEIAEYVATVLQRELDNLWDQAQQLANIRGTIAKNSFFLGLAKGYCNKIQILKTEHGNDVTRALMVIDKQLTDAKATAYPHLSSSRGSNGRYCPEASAVGEQIGRQFNINPAIHDSSKAPQTLIVYP